MVACQASPSPSAEQDLTLVFLKTGPRTDLAGEEQQKVFAGHFANMNRLAREGHLLLAGPFGAKRSDATLRGVFVFGTGDRAEAERLAATDPGIQAGVFVPEFHALRSAAPLRAMIAAELAAEDAMKAAGKTPKPGEFGRPYVLLTAEDGDAAQAALHGSAVVLLRGRLDGRGAWIVLDATDLAAAEALLAPLAAKLGSHHLDEWFATKRVAELRSMLDRESK